MGIFNLEQQIGFYAQYHNNKVNQLIHFFFVPTILWTVLVWCAQTGPLLQVPQLPPWLPANLALFVGSTYVLYYIILEPVAGLLYAPFMGFMLYYANHVASIENIILYTLALHIFSWIMQFVGHGVAEKRAPALLDNLFQALALAPLFVFLEFLFVCGYRKELANKIESDAKKNINAWKAAKKIAKEPAKVK